MKAVTVQQNEAHVTSWQDRMLNQGAFGEESYVLNIGQKMAAETYSNNEIRIRDGALVHQGCLSVIQKGTYDAVVIQNGTQGMKRIDLIVARYSKNAGTQVENVDWAVIQGTPDASAPSVPAYTEGDIQDGDLVVDMPMYQVHLNGINIEEVTAVFTPIQTMLEMQTQIGSLNSKLQYGVSGSITVPGGRNASITVTFPKPFDSIPAAVLISPAFGNSATLETNVQDVSQTQFTAVLTNRGNINYPARIYWAAFA